MTITNEQYHADPAISASHLHAVAQSPYHYWSRFLDPQRQRPEPTAAMNLGSLVHCAVLEPDELSKRYGVCLPRNTKAGKEQAAEAVLTPDDVRRMRAMRAAGNTYPQLAKHYGMSIKQIWRICNRHQWSWVE